MQRDKIITLLAHHNRIMMFPSITNNSAFFSFKLQSPSFEAVFWQWCLVRLLFCKMQNLWGDQYLSLDSTWFGNQSYWPPHSWNNVAASSPKSSTTTASSMRRGPGEVKNCLYQTFLQLWWLNNFFPFKTFFGIHVKKACVNTEDLQGAWLNLMTNKNALKSVESCLLGDKIRNEEAIRPRAVDFFFPASHTRWAKSKIKLSTYFDSKENKRLFAV